MAKLIEMAEDGNGMVNATVSLTREEARSVAGLLFEQVRIISATGAPQVEANETGK